MARYVTVSSLCVPGIPREGTSGVEAVNRMIAYWRARLEEVSSGKPDLIVLPEACDRYDAMEPREALAWYETRGNAVLNFFREEAVRMNCCIAYSAVLKAGDGLYRNCTVLIGSNGGHIGTYRKNYPMTSEIEASGIVPGTEAPVFRCGFGTVGCMICFDLNFDELRLRYAEQKPDLLLFSSRYHGGMKQLFWAYSCNAHLIGAVGGPSRPGSIIAPNGRILAETTEYTHALTERLNLDCEQVHLDFNFEKLAELKRKYGEEVRIDDNGHLGSVLVSSLSSEHTVSDFLREFEIEPLGEYLKRAETFRNQYLCGHSKTIKNNKR